MHRIVHKHVHDLDAPRESVFPLLCPVREYDWIFDWSCEMLYAESGVAELDCVFRTSFPDAPGAVWTCSRYEPSSAIDYVVFAGSHIQHLAIRLSEPSPGNTRLEWTRIFTALSADTAAGIEEFARTRLPEIDEKLKTALRHYLATGTMHRPAAAAV